MISITAGATVTGLTRYLSAVEPEIRRVETSFIMIAGTDRPGMNLV